MNHAAVDLLLVEDNPDDIELTLLALRDNRLVNNVDVLTDGAQALDYLFRRGDYADRADVNPKLMLLDLKLPLVDGLEVLKQVKANPLTCTIPVVVLTSSRQESDIATSYAHGSNSYIVKPVDFDKFTEAMRTLGLYWLLLNQPPPAGSGDG